MDDSHGSLDERTGLYGLVGAAVAVLLAGLALHAWLMQPLGLKAPVMVTVEEGLTGEQIGRLLREKGVVDSTLSFRAALWLTKAGGTLRRGTVELRPPVSMLELIRKLQSPHPFLRRVVILEGWPSWRIFTELDRQLNLSEEGFRSRFDDPAFLRSVNVPGRTLEGYLFPDTYYVADSADHEEVLRQMVGRFHEVKNKLDLARRARRLDMSLDEVVRLASLIEREARLNHERPLVSAVFHNRLERGWRLQADPTLLYGTGTYQRRIGYDLLRSDGPYNTYTRDGLPPTAICSPGRASLAASVAPADVDYLFFVAKGDGSHVFSRTRSNHDRAVERYQK